MPKQQTKRITRRQVLAASAGAGAAATFGSTPPRAAPRRTKPLKGKRVLVCLGEFSESLETYYMVYRLIEEGIRPHVVATKAKRVQLVVHDFEPQYSNYTEKPGYQLEAEIAYKDVRPAGYHGLLIPGGRGPEEIRQHQDALKIVGYFLDKDLPLGAMCHGPQAVYAARPVRGRRMAAFPGIRADVELAGAKFVDEPVVVDRRLVTSRGWPDLPSFMPTFLEVLGRK